MNNLDINSNKLEINSSDTYLINISSSNLVIDFKSQINVFGYIKLDNDLDLTINIEDYANVEIVIYTLNKISVNLISNVYESANLKIIYADIYSSDFNVNGNLLKSFANIDLYTSSIVKDNCATNINIYHKNKATTSNCTSRGVVYDNGMYQNKTIGSIDKYNAHSKCHQETKALVLGEKSVAKCDPILIIDEYDVEASHAASVGQMDLDSLYYLQSRGLSYGECISLLTQGFIVGVLDNISNINVKEEVINSLEAQL